jgi:rubredoxin
MCGIDYGGFPMESGNLPNRNPETGIRYGIIHSNNLPGWIWDEFESEYSRGCPNCGAEWDDDWTDEDLWVDEDGDTIEPSRIDSMNFMFRPECRCAHCGYFFSEDDSWSDEPIAHIHECEDWTGFADEYGDIWVTWSKYTTHGRHCSPCAPGAVSIPDDGSDLESGPECYTLPPEYFSNEG